MGQPHATGEATYSATVFHSIEVLEVTGEGAFTRKTAPAIESSLEVISIVPKERKVVYRSPHHSAAPNWSRDGKWVTFLSYEKDVNGHSANKNVMLRVLPIDGGKPKVSARLLGGQGTINVPSWSHDSQRVAFVSYRLVTP